MPKKPSIKTLKDRLCKLFGHKIDAVDLFMFEVKARSLNKVPASIACERCKKTWKVNEKTKHKEK